MMQYRYLEQIAKALTECLACSSKNLETVLDLGKQPLANSFTLVPEKSDGFPLALNYCVDCSHMQLTHLVDRSLLFENYLYASGTSDTLREDFRKFASDITRNYGVGRVLDVACNDGSQLDAFGDLGWETIGVDPARNLYDLSSKRHRVFCEFLNESHAEDIKTDIVIAQNVMAHTESPTRMLSIISKVAPIAFTQTSQANMITQNQFDTIYHEHLSFFSRRSFFELSRSVDFPLSEIGIRKIHGGSFLFENRIDGKWIDPPEKIELQDVKSFADNARMIMRKLERELTKLKDEGLLLIGYGAAAKGMTVLNSIHAYLDFIVDDAPLKQNRFAPGAGIPIYATQRLGEVDTPFALVLLAWNFEEEIVRKVKEITTTKFKIVKYFPKVTVNDNVD